MDYSVGDDIVTDHDIATFFVVAMYVLKIRPPRGESEVMDFYWDYTPGVRWMIDMAYEKANDQGYPYFLVVDPDKVIVENRAPVTWRYRIRRFLRDTFRSRPRPREWD